MATQQQTRLKQYHGSDITQSKWVISAYIIFLAFTHVLIKHCFQMHALLG